MDKKEDDYFIYRKKFNESLKSNVKSKRRLFKGKLQLFLSKNKFTSKYLDSWEVHSLKKNNWVDGKSIRHLFSESINKNAKYNKVNLDLLNYFEVIEIDNFDKYRKTIISKFGKNQSFSFSTKSQDDLKKTLNKVKINLNTISWGNLFSIDYENKSAPKNDLISYVSVNYIKTKESFFILKIEIKTSKKFKKIFKKIISSEDGSLMVPKYNSFYNIIKTKRFISHESIIPSLRMNNLDGLLGDLNQQVKYNITRHLKGYFHANNKLPSIEHYEVENIESFHKDFEFKQNFNTGFDGFYSLPDNEVEVYFTNSSQGKKTLIKTVKQKGHGIKKSSSKDLTDYDKFETYNLLHSLAFPCVFNGVLNEQFERLNKLKRKIYDYIEETNNTNFLKNILFFYYNYRYIKLKQSLTKILITTKRFESEFTKRNIQVFTTRFDLSNFESRERNIDNEKKNLLNRITHDFTSQIKSLDKKTKDTNEIFKTIEELNAYRTNFLLQIISLFIALLAFIFTFEKVKLFVLGIINKLF